MATTTRTIHADTDAVWRVLSDGWTYSNWVTGTSHMRAVGRGWPAVGTKLFHASGIWPMVTRDETEVVRSEPGRCLALIARGRPLGEAEIVITLEPGDGGVVVTMTETPVSGPGRWAHNPAFDALLHRRNVESLDRLAAVVERHSKPP